MSYILISESDRYHALMQATALRKAGHRVNIVQGLEPTLELLESGNYDLLILQGRLPDDKKPLELLQRLQPMGLHCKVLGFSNELSFFNGCDIQKVNKSHFTPQLMNDDFTRYLATVTAVLNGHPLPES